MKMGKGGLTVTLVTLIVFHLLDQARAIQIIHMHLSTPPEVHPSSLFSTRRRGATLCSLTWATEYRLPLGPLPVLARMARTVSFSLTHERKWAVLEKPSWFRQSVIQLLFCSSSRRTFSFLFFPATGGRLPCFFLSLQRGDQKDLSINDYNIEDHLWEIEYNLKIRLIWNTSSQSVRTLESQPSTIRMNFVQLRKVLTE